MAKELSFAFPEDSKKWSDKSIAIMQILTFKEFRAEEAKIIFFMRHDWRWVSCGAIVSQALIQLWRQRGKVLQSID